MADGNGKGGTPLSSEARKRAEWRGAGGTFLDEEEAAGHTLPESERDRSKPQAGPGEAAAAPTTMPPPD
jgi:hypothetical protein